MRPYGAIPAWVMSVTDRMKDGDAQKVRDAFANLFSKFVKNKFVKTFDKPWRKDVVDVMEFASGFLSLTGAGLGVLEKIGGVLASEDPKDVLEDRYVQGAISDLKKHQHINYVVFGHTHRYLLQPLDRRDVGGRADEETIYFNSGTWRKRFERAVFHPDEHEFIGHHVLTHISFYGPKDKTNRNYEVWHGALGE